MASLGVVVAAGFPSPCSGLRSGQLGEPPVKAPAFEDAELDFGPIQPVAVLGGMTNFQP